MSKEDHSSSNKIRVLVTHEVCLLREGLASLLRRFLGFAVFNLHPDEIEYKKIQGDGTVDVVLTVADGTTNRAADKIQKIKRAFPNAKVVMIGTFGTSNEILEIIEAGASGYAFPDSCLENIVETIQDVYRGKLTCSPDVLPLIFERVASLRTQLQMVNDDRLGSLTQQELKVLKLVADGMSNKEIAEYFHLEVQTVKNHVHRILEKLRVINRQEAALLTQNHGLFVKNNGDDNGWETTGRLQHRRKLSTTRK
jgi:two-component system nitrate/nitrite response regulator NarL